MKKILLLGCVAWLMSCGDVDSVNSESSELDELFVPPTESMKEQVRQDWAARSHHALGSQLVWDTLIPVAVGANTQNFKVSVVSHKVDQAKHYGAVVAPSDSVNLPTLIYAHGGDNGVDISEILLLLRVAPELGRYSIVVPSFRSEPLQIETQEWLSEGNPSPWDRDVDDLLQFLSALDSLGMEGYRDTLAGLGISRGGGTILLAAIREPRLTRVVDFFGPTDFFGDFVRSECEAIWWGTPSDRPGVSSLTELFIEPLQSGVLSIPEARQALLRRSPKYFAEDLPALQIHHGGADTVVPIAESQALWAAYELAHGGNTESAFYRYDNAGHNPLMMVPPFSSDNAVQRAVTFLSGQPLD